MMHSMRCENAKHDKCVCRCRGTLHKLYGQRHDNEMPISKEKIISMSGEIEKKLSPIIDKWFNCSCGVSFQLSDFLGYPHDNGLADNNSKKYWIYVRCPKCGYDWSWQKILRRFSRPNLNYYIRR